MNLRWLIPLFVVAACRPPGATRSALPDAVRTYTEGVRWERFEAAAVVIPPAERAAFVDERDTLAKDLRITDAEIIHLQAAERTAEAAVKLTWYSEREGVLHTTVAHQRWERQGKAWRLVDEVRGRGEPMPGLRERDPDEGDDDGQPGSPLAASVRD